MYPLEPDRTEMERIAGLVTGRAVRFVDGLVDRPASHDHVDDDLLRRVSAPPSEEPGSLEELLDRLDAAAGCALETAGGGYFGYIPGGGVYTSAVAELYARAVNRFGGWPRSRHRWSRSSRASSGGSPRPAGRPRRRAGC